VRGTIIAQGTAYEALQASVSVAIERGQMLVAQDQSISQIAVREEVKANNSASEVDQKCTVAKRVSHLKGKAVNQIWRSRLRYIYFCVIHRGESELVLRQGFLANAGLLISFLLAEKFNSEALWLLGRPKTHWI
jgi:hypothetical protein